MIADRASDETGTIDLSDQANRLRSLFGPEPARRVGATTAIERSDRVMDEPAARDDGVVIAIASGKGGVGKTNIAVNLAAALARAGVPTTLIDGDLGLANADLLCDVQPSGHLGHVLGGTASMNDIARPTRAGFTLLPGGSGPGMASADDPGIFGGLIERVLKWSQETAPQSDQRKSRALLIDCGAGIGPAVRGFLRAADLNIVVATPEPPAVTDAYALLKWVARSRTGTCADPLVGLVINRSRSMDEAGEIYSRLGGACRRFLRLDPPLLGVVREDRAVVEAVHRRGIFTIDAPSCDAARDIRDLSISLIKAWGLAPAHTSIGGNSTMITRMVRRVKTGLINRVVRPM